MSQVRCITTMLLNLITDCFPLQLPESSTIIEETVRHGTDFRALTVDVTRKRIGPSQTYDLSCKQYRWPLLAPLALEEPGPSWLKPYPATKLQQRLQMVCSMHIVST